MRATSRGFVKLKTVNPYDHPIINPNYLSTEEDRVELRDSIRLTREIFNQKAFDPFRGKELQPGKDLQSVFNLHCWKHLWNIQCKLSIACSIAAYRTLLQLRIFNYNTVLFT